MERNPEGFVVIMAQTGLTGKLYSGYSLVSITFAPDVRTLMKQSLVLYHHRQYDAFANTNLNDEQYSVFGSKYRRT